MRRTTKQFIEEARLVHENKYDYSKTIFKTVKDKVIIICPIHGEFEQLPLNHLSGKGCRQCSIDKRKKIKIKKHRESITYKDFLKEIQIKYGNKFDYSNTEYINTSTKIRVRCKKCNKVFEVFPYNHFVAGTCPFCKQKEREEKFFESVKDRNYDYSKAHYVNSRTKIEIICPKHGSFFQTPKNHLEQECPECVKELRIQSLRKDTEQFVKEANKIHGKYDYSLVEYENTHTKVKIICPIHGVFKQTPNVHLLGHGCPKCNESKGEKEIASWLSENNISFKRQKKFKDLKDKTYLSYDFYLPDYNLLIEYNGEQHYRNVYNKPLHDFHRQKHHDWLKRKYAKYKEINLLTITYKDDILLVLEKSLVKGGKDEELCK
jgi:phage FluMu protein Com